MTLVGSRAVTSADNRQHVSARLQERDTPPPVPARRPSAQEPTLRTRAEGGLLPKTHRLAMVPAMTTNPSRPALPSTTRSGVELTRNALYSRTTYSVSIMTHKPTERVSAGSLIGVKTRPSARCKAKNKVAAASRRKYPDLLMVLFICRDLRPAVSRYRTSSSRVSNGSITTGRARAGSRHWSASRKPTFSVGQLCRPEADLRQNCRGWKGALAATYDAV